MTATNSKLEFARIYKEQLADQANLPPLPHTVHELIALKNSEHADVRLLAQVIEGDPLLAAQTLRYAQSPLFGYGDRIGSIQEAISLVLGFEPALYMALGLAVGTTLKTPAEGPLGLEVLWRDAFYNAELCVELARRMPAAERPPLGLCHLAGLLHNIGFLVLGHLHPTRFRLLSTQFSMDTSRDIRRLEEALLGVSHDVSGMWLAQAWGLPEEVVVAIGRHHEEGYQGENAVFAWLVNIASHLLSDHGVPEMAIDTPAPQLVEALGLDGEKLEEALARVLEGQGELRRLACSMAGG